MPLISRFVYSLILCLALPLLLGYLLLRSRKDACYRKRFAERFAISVPAKAARSGLIVHTVSVGEFNAARPLIKRLLTQYPGLPLTITCTTPTASAAISQFIAAQSEKAMLFHQYLPFDFPFLMRRWLGVMQPQMLVILETELWPNMLAACQALAVPAVVVNARLSKRSAQGYRKVALCIKPMLRQLRLIITQDSASAKRFDALGAAEVICSGNLKYELDIAPATTELAQQLAPALHGRTVWVAGSTHAGEDEILLQAYSELKIQFPQLLLILVPRHPERFAAVAQLLQTQQLSFVRRSEQQVPDAKTDIWLADSMGELLSWYQLADLVFVGGSLIERGGHNPLEAMAFAKTVITGPHIFNFQQAFSALQQQQACFTVHDVMSLTDTMQQLLLQPELAKAAGRRGYDLFIAHQGAVERTVAQLSTVLPPLHIATVSKGNDSAWYDPEFFPDFGLHYFKPQYWQAQRQVSGQSSGRNTVWFIEQDGRQAVLRHYYRGGMIGKVNKDRFWPVAVAHSRAMAEFRLLAQMRQWQLPVPRPCAALYREQSWGYSADILIERISNARDLSQLLQQRALTQHEWQQVGHMLGRFHARGVYHSDMNCHNILLDNDGKCWLIDFDKCAVRVAGSWQQATLARLKRSLTKELTQLPVFHWQAEQWQWLLEGYKMSVNAQK